MFNGTLKNTQLQQRVVAPWCFSKATVIVYERLQEINVLFLMGNGDARTCPVIVSTSV